VSIDPNVCLYQPISCSMNMAALFRVFAFISKDLETAQVAPAPVLMIQMFFSGFLLTRNHMGWLIFLHYISICTCFSLIATLELYK
jgi:ABC-type multidrug transport system permease subunit